MICFQNSLAPSKLQTDNGAEFVSQEFVEFALALTGKPPRTTKPRSPQTNGMFEQSHGTLKDRLTAHLCRKGEYGWASYLQHATYAMNLNQSRGLRNLSPYEVFFNQKRPSQAILFSARPMTPEQFRVVG